MEGFMGHQLICRACLRIVENKTQSFGFIEDANGNLKDMIMCCVPEMDIYVSANPIMCFPCIQLLVTVYNFKTRCLNTETIIRSYIQRNNLTEYNQVNLSCIVQELIRLNNYFREAQYRRMDGDRQIIEGSAQSPNGLPKYPFEPPQGIHGGHFQIPESHGKVDSRMVPMDFEHAPENRVIGPHQQRVQGDMEDMNPDTARNHFLGHQGLETQKGTLHSIPTIPQDTVPGYQILNRDEVVSNQHTKEDRDMLKNQSIQSNEDDTDNPVTQESHFPVVENHSNEHEDVSKLGSSTTEAIDNKTTATLPEKDAAKKSEDNTNSTTSKSEGQKDSIAENRPRLIIKICKNKITIPSRNEDFNEKENEKMDEEMDRTEIPPLEISPMEIYKSPETGQELYQCMNCTFITTNLDYYITHKNVCGSDLVEKKCPHCPHVTNRQYALNKHINTMHTKSVWYSCDFCTYRSTDSSCLRRHKRNVHPERLENDLMCHLCSYRCTTEYHLKKHLLKHDENSALQCQFCSYSTRDRSNFRKHIFIHNPKPRECDFCDYKCVSPYQMKLHLKKFHHGVGMEDVDCRSAVSISEVVQDISAAIKEAKCYDGHQTE